MQPLDLAAAPSTTTLAMEKKQEAARSSSVARQAPPALQLPTNATEAKGKQDGNFVGKAFSRSGGVCGGGAGGGGRRRRNFRGEKRPPARGPVAPAAPGHGRRGDGPAAAAMAGPMTQDDEFEVGSVFNAGSKKHNMNHLLNFQFEARGSNGSSGGAAAAAAANDRHQPFWPTRKRNQTHRNYNKEQYLQANCQFIVKASGDYGIHLSDPDKIVDWDQIEQVRLRTTEVPSCPICLYPPTAAKIAKCGHVFCWSCLLHYLALSDHAWRKCPICYEAIYKQDLKSVVSLPHREFSVGCEICLRLMRRERNSLFALPVQQQQLGSEEPPPPPPLLQRHPNVDAEDGSYSQLLLATPDKVREHVLAKERKELEEQYRTDCDEPESCFIEEALRYLRDREASTLAAVGDDCACAPPPPAAPAKVIPGLHPSMMEPDHERQRQDSVGDIGVADLSRGRRQPSSSSDGDGSSGGGAEDDDDGATVTPDRDLDVERTRRNNAAAEKTKQQQQLQPKDTFYFYQSSDGQPIFLHAINVQMLVLEYGGFDNCPQNITAKILEKDDDVMTEDLRNKLRYLRHLPLTSRFEVAEIQMKTTLVSKQTISAFASQLDGRRRKRNRRARDEKSRDKRIQVEKNKQLLGKFPEPKIRIESSFHFPEVGRGVGGPPAHRAAEMRPGGGGGRGSTAMTRSNESLASVGSGCSSDGPPTTGEQTAIGTQCRGAAKCADVNSNGISFAKILRESAPSKAVVPARGETFPRVSGRGGGVASSEERASGRARSDSGGEADAAAAAAAEEYALPPPPRASIGDALAQALEQAATIGGGGGAHPPGSAAAAAADQQTKEAATGKKKSRKMKGKKFSLTSAAASRPEV